MCPRHSFFIARTFIREYPLALFPIVASAKHVLSLQKGQGPSTSTRKFRDIKAPPFRAMRHCKCSALSCPEIYVSTYLMSFGHSKTSAKGAKSLGSCLRRNDEKGGLPLMNNLGSSRSRRREIANKRAAAATLRQRKNEVNRGSARSACEATAYTKCRCRLTPNAVCRE